MPTVPQLKISSDTRIRNKTLVHSILRTEVGDQFDEVGLELLLRGMPQVAATADLIAESHLNTNLILVPDYGIFKAYSSVLVPDNVDSFYSADIGWLWIRVLASPVVTPDYSTFISSGGFRTWVSGYNYDVAPSTYQINGVGYAILTTSNITLAPSDVLLDRFDQIVVDDNQQVVVITGVPGENPQVPSHDPATQAVLGSVLVKANTAAPIIPQEWIYREDVEWATVESHPTVVSNSPNNAAAGLVTIEGTAALPAHNIRFNAPAPFSPAATGLNVLKFRIDPKAAWSVVGSGFRIQFYNGVTAVGSPVLFQNNSYGFDSSNLTYQPIVIPLASFGNLPTISAMVITISGNVPTSLGFYLDEIELQGADIPPNGGKYFEHGGNGWGHTAILGTRDNFDLSLILNNIERGKFRTTDVFEYRGNVHLTGSNKGISFFTGTFAASDYYVKRTGTSMIVNAAGLVELQVGQRAGVTVNPNGARGIEFYDMQSPVNSVTAQILPSGVTSLKKYGLGNLQAAPAYLAGWDSFGNFVEVPVPGGGGGGSVTSVGLGNITNFATATSTTTNPVTAAGQLGYTLNTQSPNLVFAGPATGLAAVPTFRALVAADIGSLYTADNAITRNTATNFQWGGALTSGNTIITGTGAHHITINGGPTVGEFFIVTSSTPNTAIKGQSAGGLGLYGVSTAGGTGSAGYSSSGTALEGYSDSGLPLSLVRNTSITNTAVRQVSILAQSTGTAANGFGSYIEFVTQASTGIQPTSHQIISKWTTANYLTRVSEFSIKGVNNATLADILKIGGDGTVTLPGSPYVGLGAGFLAVSNTGVLSWSAGSGGGGGGGTVTSVSGTANRISISGTAAAPIVNIDVNYVGQNTITTLGTVGTGTWQGTTVSTAYGGTGQTTYLDGEILIGSTAGGSLSKSTISSGIGINVVNGAGSITVNSMFNHAVQFPAVTTSGLYTWNVTNGENLRWRISGAGNSLAFSNTIAGRYYTVEIIQNVGGATVTTWPAGTIWFGGVAPTLSIVTGEVDCVVFYFNGINYLAQPNALAGSITPLSGGGTGSNLSDPNADRILFWDDSAGAVTWLTVGSGMNITGTTMTATGTAYTGSNGLTLASNDFKLGGTLLANTTVDTAGFTLTVSTATGGISPLIVDATTGVGVTVTTTTGIALTTFSTGATGPSAQFTINPSSTNTVVNVLKLNRSTSGTGAAGIGASIDFNVNTDSTGRLSNQLISKWNTVTDGSRVSEFSVTGVNNAITGTILKIGGDGAVTLPGTPYVGFGAGYLAVSNTGVLSWSAGTGGGTITGGANGLSSSGANVILGGNALTGNTTIPTSAFSLTINSSVTTLVVTTSDISSYAITGTSAGNGIHGVATSNGSGVSGSSTTGPGGNFFTSDGGASSVDEVVRITKSTSGTASNGIGGMITFITKSTSGFPISNTIISKWTNVTHASRVSEFSVTGVDNAVDTTILKIAGNGDTTLIGGLSLSVAGNKISIATGSNASVGVSGAMTAGSITISTTAVTASSRIYLTHATLGGTQGVLSVGTITAGTSFVINSSSNTDTGTVNWWIVN